MRFLIALLFAAPALAGEITTSTVEWITLSGDARALWIEGAAPDGPVKLELRVADDTLVLASRETIASNGRFSSLLRPKHVENAAYSVEINASHAAARVAVLAGTEEEREEYAKPEAAWLGDAYERVVSLTDELHRFHDEKNAERWRLWSPGWEQRRKDLQHDLDEFRTNRAILARAREYYRLVSSLCFAKTLHDLYAAELNSRGGEPGGESSDWSGALAQQLDEFKEARTPVTAEDVAGWARDLADDDGSTRDRASRGLARAGELAREALAETAKGCDVEAAGRARELLFKLDEKK